MYRTSSFYVILVQSTGKLACLLAKHAFWNGRAAGQVFEQVWLLIVFDPGACSEDRHQVCYRRRGNFHPEKRSHSLLGSGTIFNLFLGFKYMSVVGLTEPTGPAPNYGSISKIRR